MLIPILFALLIIIIGIAAYFYVQNHGFWSMIWKEVEQLTEGSAVEPDPVRGMSELPVAMQRYLRFAIPDERPAAGLLRLQHGGTLTLKPGMDPLPIEGEEYFHCSDPAFIWTGRARMKPLVWVRARDKYLHGRGNMLVKLRAAVTLADSRGPEMDSSSLLRYLAEMPWLPSSFLAVPGLVFTQVDDRTVEVHLTHRSITVSGRFTIDDDGAMTNFHSEDRYREDNGTMVRCPWKGEYRDYREVDGFRIPHEATVAWELPEGDFPYAHFQLTCAEYDIPAAF